MSEEDMKVSLKTKKKKSVIKIFLRKKKQKLVECRRNYYLKYKK